MLKTSLFIALIFTIGLNAACSSASAPNSNGTTSNANTAAPANIPPEFSNTQVTPSGNQTPGIPDPRMANVNINPKGTPTPGIPDPKTINKTPVPKGATPTPGIPDPKVLKEQMNKTVNDPNLVNEIPKNLQDAEKKVDEKLKTVRKPNQ